MLSSSFVILILKWNYLFFDGVEDRIGIYLVNQLRIISTLVWKSSTFNLATLVRFHQDVRRDIAEAGEDGS